MQENFLIEELMSSFHASKNREYRQRALDSFATWVRYFQEHDLMTRTILAEGQQPDWEMEVRRFDLTDEGFELYKQAVGKWYNGHDRGKPISDTKIFDKTLSKIREQKLKEGLAE